MGPSVPPQLHELEAEVMAEVWRQEETTVRAVLEALNDRSRKRRAYTTVMTIMQRLVEKQMLARQRVGKADVYVPTMSNEEFRDARARAEVGALVDEFGDVALTHFAAQMAQLDPKHRDKLRRIARGG